MFLHIMDVGVYFYGCFRLIWCFGVNLKRCVLGLRSEDMNSKKGELYLCMVKSLETFMEAKKHVDVQITRIIFDIGVLFQSNFFGRQLLNHEVTSCPTLQERKNCSLGCMRGARM